MNLEELREEIELKAGIPSHLLSGETPEEVIATSKALLALKRETEPQRKKSARELFTEWNRAQTGEPEPLDEAGAALAEIEERARVECGGYPRIKDDGEVTGLPDPRPTREQFAEWLGSKSSWDPFKGNDGWKPII